MPKYRDVGLVLLAALIGVLAGVVVFAMSWIAYRLNVLLFLLPDGIRISAQASLAHPMLALVPAAGGALMGASIWLARRSAARRPIDPIEANALYGGRMSLNESIRVAAQTIISNGFGASVGLEAGYTQMGAGIASRIARALKLRRADVRMLVGCGAAGAISAAFAAPITGAFYAFELIIGVYSVALVAPVMAAALAASVTASLLGAVQTPVDIGIVPALRPQDLVPFLVLGVIGGLVSVAIMRLVALVEQGFSLVRLPAPIRPVLGGALVGMLGLMAPQVLSSGHGVLHVELGIEQGILALAALFVLKILASAISLGSGFRGGLFFASLVLGALLGKLFEAGVVAAGVGLSPEPVMAAVVGMACLAVGIVGGPMTMTFLVLETTNDIAISGAVLAASIMSSVVVRETFGYSFSTWRLHLRGETIRSAQDIGWIRNLTVGSMMRSDVKTVPLSATLGQFRAAIPLGSTQRVIALDEDGRYAGIVLVADAYLEDSESSGSAADRPSTIAGLLRCTDCTLVPSMDAKEAAMLFEQSNTEELAVVDDPESRWLVGLLTEGHLLRRYAEEVDRARRDLAGEG
ncbi:MAG TPA: chloride channel protein [Geminicoccus sp.]|jgi:CIC family chloride channel protein|uniref:chloride channel protein n=1 Tax=Geminicoccus sp. TaxID=2024832 RepID=UPI002E36D778|nr:chloride channel protein [Geminicoccus sp.]HEX2528131.1 chloride channel protein [Geminicoccus sp.]